MHGIEPQTIESLQLLRQRKTPFIVALNKIDRLFDWKAMPGAPVKETLKKQSKHVIQQYEELVKQTIINFAEQGYNNEISLSLSLTQYSLLVHSRMRSSCVNGDSFNAVLYYENKDFKRNVALVPTSAITGEGIPDLLMLVVQLTQKMMSDRFVYLSDKFEATVLEVKVVEGLGTTIDVILTNGIIRDTDTIVLCGLNGPICTTIRALLTPQPLKEIRVKSPYIHHKEVKAAQGIKISAQGLEGAVPGGQLFIVGPEDDVEELKERVQQDLDQTLNNLRLDKDGRGVYVQASTLGSLEALLEFLKTSKIPVAGINIGPIHKKDVMKAAVMLERDPAYAVILGFNVEPTRDAREHATALGVQIFTAEIIYHLEDAFIKYLADVKAQKQAQAANDIVWPCILEVLLQHHNTTTPTAVSTHGLIIRVCVTLVRSNRTASFTRVIPSRSEYAFSRECSRLARHSSFPRRRTSTLDDACRSRTTTSRRTRRASARSLRLRFKSTRSICSATPTVVTLTSLTRFTAAYVSCTTTTTSCLLLATTYLRCCVRRSADLSPNDRLAGGELPR